MMRIAKTLILAVLIGISAIAIGQTKTKFGHIDSNELLKIMPGRDSAKIQLEKYAKSIEQQFQGMQAELESKYQNFMANQATMTELIQKTKTEELQNLQARIEAFQKSAQEDLQKKEEGLLSPIINSAREAITEVAKENKFTYIFDIGTGAVLYFEAGEDILPLVKTKLGIK